MEKLEKFFTEEEWIKYFKIFCVAEGITCFLLYLIAMPLKYSFDWTLVMIPAGSLHGLFFTLYLIACLPIRKIFEWDDEDFVFALLAAFFPFGTFWVEKKLGKKKELRG